MIDHVLVKTVRELGQDWLWMEDAQVIVFSAGLPAERLAAALEEAAALVRMEDARAAGVTGVSSGRAAGGTDGQP